MRDVEDPGPPQFTYAMTGVLTVFFLTQLNATDVGRFFAFPWRVADGEMWRLVTSTFLHGSIIHFLFNVIWFFRFSKVIEFWLGPWVSLLLYLAFAVGSMGPQLLFGGGGPPIGASGVVYGYFGFLWVVRRRYTYAAEVVTPHTIQWMLAWLGICLVVNLMGGHIANTAHVFGLAFGWLAGQAVVGRRHLRIAIAAATLVGWGLLFAMTYGPVHSATLAHVPWLGRKYATNVPLVRPEIYVQLSPEQREQVKGQVEDMYSRRTPGMGLGND